MKEKNTLEGKKEKHLRSGIKQVLINQESGILHYFSTFVHLGISISIILIRIDLHVIDVNVEETKANWFLHKSNP